MKETKNYLVAVINSLLWTNRISLFSGRRGLITTYHHHLNNSGEFFVYGASECHAHHQLLLQCGRAITQAIYIASLYSANYFLMFPFTPFLLQISQMDNFLFAFVLVVTTQQIKLLCPVAKPGTDMLIRVYTTKKKNITNVTLIILNDLFLLQKYHPRHLLTCL